MLTEKSLQRLIKKVDRLITTYENYAFKRICILDTQIYETEEFCSKPPVCEYRNVKKGEQWGKDFSCGWFKVSVPEKFTHKVLYLELDTGAVEHLVFLNGEPIGATDVMENGATPWFRLHKYVEINVSESTEIYAEGYASHKIAGCMPMDKPTTNLYNGLREKATFSGVYLCEKRNAVWQTAILLRFLSAAYADTTLSRENRKYLEDIYIKVFQFLPAFPEEVGEENTMNACEKCNCYLKDSLPKSTDKEKFPLIAVIGHAHMDTVWLWDTDETKRKLARTAINAINLMDRYPEYKFIMSSTLHYEWLKDLYPELFKRIKYYVDCGRFEPNGGSYIECDANLASGESMVRQFLFGYKFNECVFNYHADTYWLPDTFGYSAAIPQILKGFGMSNFMTTKIACNDTNRFPYDNFYWEGIDGSRVFSSFNILQCYVDNATVNQRYDYINGKDSFKGTLLSYGFGDGGGGPDESMVEIARLCKKSAFTPNVEHMTVSEYCRNAVENGKNLPVYAGELYFESHRGTFTTLSEIKRNNRKLEYALSNVEKIIASNKEFSYLKEEFDEIYKILLLNQFHDILPGTSIDEVNVNVFNRYKQAFDRLNALVEKMNDGTNGRFVYNFNDLDGQFDLDVEFNGQYPTDYKSDRYVAIDGTEMLKIFNVDCKAFSKMSLNYSEIQNKESNEYFNFSQNQISTPYFNVTLGENNQITHLFDKEKSINVINEKGAFNSFSAFEDVPLYSDNWDIDEDIYLKEKPAVNLLKSYVVCNGKHLRLRSEYSLCSNSKLTQDLIFYSNSKRIDFETKIDWAEKHTLLRTYFDTAIISDNFKSEIQFGHISRSTKRETDEEKAKHEVCQHKWSDISNGKFGVAILNDSKYGVSCQGGKIGLTLIKSGTHPDTTADEGTHYFKYSLLLHDGDVSAENVVRPAIYYNNPPIISRVNVDFELPFKNNSENFVLETVKLAENGSGLILRGYNCCEKKSILDISFNKEYDISICDMAENKIEEIGRYQQIKRNLRKFEIITIRIQEI